ncbi:MAG: hypothetical protein ACPGSD_04950 [Flavobacteriales bacterium]
MKTILTTILIISSMSFCSAQKLKKEKVILNDKEIAVEKNGPDHYDGDDYIKIDFSEKDILIETRAL